MSDVITKAIADNLTRLEGDVTFGPDVEVAVLSHEGRILREHDLDFFEYYRETVTAKLQKADVLWTDKFKGNGVEVDGNLIEIQVKPQSAFATISAFQTARKVFDDVAQEFGVRAFFMNSHWHFNRHADGADQFRESKESADVTRKFRQSAAGVLEFQRVLPAFFVTPRIAELMEDRETYKGAKTFSFNAGDARSSVRRGDWDNQYLTIEPRLSVGAPLQPVYLLTQAMVYGEQTDGHCIECPTSQNEMIALDASSIKSAGNMDYDDQVETFLGGYGQYLRLMHRTRDNLDKYDLIPSAVAKQLMSDTITRYEAHLSSEKNRMGHSLSARRQIEDVQARLDCFKNGGANRRRSRVISRTRSNAPV